MDAAGIYGRSRRRLTELVRSLPPEAARTPVPACPDWTVHDVVAHLAGVAVDIQAGRTEGAATPPWTARQVEERRARTLEDVVAEWAEAGPGLEAMVATVPALSAVAMDVLTHEWDVRGAVGRPGDKDDDDVDAVLQAVLSGLGGRLTSAGVAPLRIRAGTDEWLLGAGDGPPGATLSIEPFELFRVLFGRRSRGQLRAWGWEGEPDEYLDLLPVFRPSEVELVE